MPQAYTTRAHRRSGQRTSAPPAPLVSHVLQSMNIAHTMRMCVSVYMCSCCASRESQMRAASATFDDDDDVCRFRSACAIHYAHCLIHGEHIHAMFTRARGSNPLLLQFRRADCVDAECAPTICISARTKPTRSGWR